MKYWPERRYGFTGENVFFHDSGYVGSADLSEGFDVRDVIVLETVVTERGVTAVRWCLAGGFTFYLDCDRGLGSLKPFDGAVRVKIVGSVPDYFGVVVDDEGIEQG